MTFLFGQAVPDLVVQNISGQYALQSEYYTEFGTRYQAVRAISV